MSGNAALRTLYGILTQHFREAVDAYLGDGGISRLGSDRYAQARPNTRPKAETPCLPYQLVAAGLTKKARHRNWPLWTMLYVLGPLNSLDVTEVCQGRHHEKISGKKECFANGLAERPATHVTKI